MKRIAQRQNKETATRPTVRKTAAQTAVAKAKVMSHHQRQEFWRSQGIDPKKVKTHTDGIRGPIQLKVYDNEHGKRNAYLRALGLDPAKVPQTRHNRKIKLRLV